MDQSNIPEPKMDALAATRMLENIFEESNVSANTVPASALADHQSLHRKKYFGLRVLLIIVMVIWLLVPILFLKPDFSLSQNQKSNRDLPVYTIEVDSLLPVTGVEAYLNGNEIQMYQKDPSTYAVEPDRNGILEIRVTAANRQRVSHSVTVSQVGEPGPKLISGRIDRNGVYLELAENGTATILYDEIFALGGQSGAKVVPKDWDEESGTVRFEIPREPWDVYIPDSDGNVLHLSIDSQ